MNCTLSTMILIASLAYGQAQDSATGLLRGRVVNSVTGAPVKKAAISVLPRGPIRGPLPPLHTVTDEMGRFALARLPAIPYWVQVHHPNYPQHRQGLEGQQGTLTTVQEGSEKEITIPLVPPGSISGKVTDQDGDPMSGQVQLMEKQDRGPMPVHFATSDDRGIFRLFDIPAGRYYLQVRTNQQVAQPRPLMSREELQRQPGPSYVSTFYPNSNTLQGATPINLEPGALIEGIEMRLKPVLAVSVSGRIVFPGENAPLPGVHVTLRHRNADGTADWSSTLPAMTNRGREFVVANVTPGSYLLEAMMRTPERVFLAKQPLDVGDSPLKDIALAMRSSIDLLLNVQTTQDYIPLQDGPDSPPGVTIQSFPNSPVYAMPDVQRQSDGTTIIKNLLPGSWDIQPNMGYIKSMRLGNREISGSVLNIGEEDTGPLQVVISNRYSQIRGSVQGAQGKMVNVVLFDPRKNKILQWTQVSPDGQFQAQVAPGEYKALSVVDVDPSRLQNPTFKEWLLSHAADVKVEADGQTSLSVPLFERAAIERAYREAMEKQPQFE